MGQNARLRTALLLLESSSGDDSDVLLLLLLGDWSVSMVFCLRRSHTVTEPEMVEVAMWYPFLENEIAEIADLVVPCINGVFGKGVSE